MATSSYLWPNGYPWWKRTRSEDEVIRNIKETQDKMVQIMHITLPDEVLKYMSTFLFYDIRSEAYNRKENMENYKENIQYGLLSRQIYFSCKIANSHLYQLKYIINDESDPYNGYGYDDEYFYYESDEEEEEEPKQIIGGNCICTICGNYVNSYHIYINEKNLCKCIVNVVV